MMIPWEATIIPNYLTVGRLHWKDTFQGLAAPFMATAFGTFLLRQFFMSIPKDLQDAATIDGCGHLRFLSTIVVPLARPALGTLAVYSFLQTYNQYTWPLLITNKPEMRTVQIGMALLQDEERFMWNVVMAGVVIILVPTITLFIVGQSPADSRPDGGRCQRLSAEVSELAIQVLNSIEWYGVKVGDAQRSSGCQRALTRNPAHHLP